MLKTILTFILICLFSLQAMVQESDFQDQSKISAYGHALRVYYQYGSVLQTNEYIRGEYESGEPIKNYQAVSFQFGWQTKGIKLWHQLYGNPAWGFGIYHADFSRPDDLGAPTAIYGYYTGPFKRWNKWSVNYEVNMGYSFNWKAFDEVNNAYQISLGSDKAVYANLGIQLQYEVTNFFDLDAGISFTHFSNGSTIKPNKGINLIAPRFGIKYHLKEGGIEVGKMEIPEYQNNWEWIVSFTYGKKQVAFDTTNAAKEINRRYVGVNYSIFGLSSGIYRQFSHKSKIGIGIDFLYDESINAKIDLETGQVTQNTSGFSDRVAIGIYPAYELAVNRVSLYVQSGIYVIRKKRDGQIPALYQRIGLKYHIFKNIFAGVSLKAYNFKVADFVEWNVGYRLKWQ